MAASGDRIELGAEIVQLIRSVPFHSVRLYAAAAAAAAATTTAFS